MGNIIVVAIVVVLLIIGVLHYKKTLQSGCCGEHDQIKKIGTGDKDKNLYSEELKPFDFREFLKQFSFSKEAKSHIDDMFCKNCAATIENAFNQHKEYLASVNMNKKEITILSMNQPNLETYKQMIIKLGYTPR